MIIGRFNIRSYAVLLGVTLLAACVGTKEEEAYEERPVEVLYNEAQDLLDREDYGKAAIAFDEVERQHPYSKWAIKAQIMAGYAHYMRDRYDEAIVTLDRFLQLHPSNDNAPYVQYLKALCYYEQISDVSRDQKMTELARISLSEVAARYPESRYARDARIKLDLTNDHLAGKQMEIGRYYLVRGHYLAALNRFKLVVDDYQTTSHVPEALHRMAESYESLGLREEARKAAAVLGYNYPSSDWYLDSYEMIENEQVRIKGEGPAWYEFWESDKDAKRYAVERKPGTEGSWWNLWRPQMEEPKAAAVVNDSASETADEPPAEGEGSEPPADPAAADDDPWWKFW